MAKFPLRFFGLLLLSVAIGVPGCQALYHSTTIPAVLEQQNREVDGP